MGRDIQAPIGSGISGMFLSARPRGMRRFHIEWPLSVESVSIRASAWDATRIGVKSYNRETFLSARPRGTRPPFSASSSAAVGFLSARPRGTRHELQAHTYIAGLVSIRASAWDATQIRAELEFVTGVSIRASAWDAT